MTFILFYVSGTDGNRIPSDWMLLLLLLFLLLLLLLRQV
jgi:hypothetical protein